MKKIGNTLYELRKKSGYSAADLAEGICSTKYIYMIENDERVPSAEIMNKILNRLNFDYHDLITFSEIEKPIMASKLVKEINLLLDHEDITHMDHKLAQLEKMHNGELNQYVGYIRACILLIEEKIEKAKSLCIEVLDYEFNSKFKKEMIGYYNLYELFTFNLLGRILYQNKEYKSGYDIIHSIYSFFKDYEPLTRFNDLIIANRLNLSNVLFEEGNYQESLNILNQIVLFQEKGHNSYKSHIIHFTYARVYKEMGLLAKSKEEVIIARNYCEKFELRKQIAKLDLFQLTLNGSCDNLEQSHYKLIIENTIYSDNFEEIAIIKYFEPELILVILKKVCVGCIDKVFVDIEENLKHFGVNRRSVDLIYDVRDLQVNELGVYMSMNRQPYTRNNLQSFKVRKLVRIQERLQIVNVLTEMYHSEIEEYIDEKVLTQVIKVKNLNEALLIVRDRCEQ